jgi:hypothetical protein
MGHVTSVRVLVRAARTTVPHSVGLTYVVRALLSSALCLTSACPSAPTGLEIPSPIPSRPLPAGALPRDEVRAAFALLNAAAQQPSRLDGFFSAGRAPDQQRMLNDLLAGRVAMARDAVAPCVRALQLEGGNPALSDDRITEDIGGGNDACRQLWIPNTSLGEPCQSDFACIDGFCERSDWSRPEELGYALASCGVCSPRGEAGAVCDGHGWVGARQECSPELICTADRCEAAPLGVDYRRCTEEQPCAAGFECRPYTSSAGSEYRACFPLEPLADGSPCSPVRNGSFSCASHFCLAAGVCGQPEVGSGCGYDWECGRGKTCLNGSCAISMEGSTCAYGSSQCADGFRCVGVKQFVNNGGQDFQATCISKMPRDLGAACEIPDQCPVGARCAHELPMPRCVRLLALGDRCGRDPELDLCVPMLSCIDGVCAIPPDAPPPPSGYCLLPPE